MTTESLFKRARECLTAATVEAKLTCSARIAADWRAGMLMLDDHEPPMPVFAPGTPPRPVLVPPRQVPRRRLTTPAGHAAFVHAIAHIEFNAINLAWDAVYRFRGLPREYYDDWVRIAAEEAYHFSLLRDRLRALGHEYGDFAAHNGLWEMAEKSADDLVARMALVPRVLEARGLDVTPAMMRRLRDAGDPDTAAALAIILRDEIGHVAAGTRWFRHACALRQIDPDAAFGELLERFCGEMQGRIQGPFHDAARDQAGFSAKEMSMLADLSHRRRG
jgi:uncharacterized ferritin-like protein (DUF455 family)